MNIRSIQNNSYMPQYKRKPPLQTKTEESSLSCKKIDEIPSSYLRGSFGIINNNDSEVQKVVLKVDAFQSNYIRNLPLHDSQKETKRTDKYSIFEYHLKPEFDFEQEIFSNMDAMEVLEPLWLREEVKERIKNLASKYL